MLRAPGGVSCGKRFPHSLFNKLSEYGIGLPGQKVVDIGTAHFDWIPLKGNVVEATENLIQAYNSEWNLAEFRKRQSRRIRSRTGKIATKPVSDIYASSSTQSFCGNCKITTN